MSFDDTFNPFDEFSYQDNLMLFSALNSNLGDEEEESFSFPVKLPQEMDVVRTFVVYSSGEDQPSYMSNNGNNVGMSSSSQEQYQSNRNFNTFTGDSRIQFTNVNTFSSGNKFGSPEKMNFGGSDSMKYGNPDTMKFGSSETMSMTNDYTEMNTFLQPEYKSKFSDHGNDFSSQQDMFSSVDDEDIEILEKKLRDLETENWMIKKEHELLIQESISGNDGKPTPLLRSFSTELRDSDREIDNIMKTLHSLTQSQANEEAYIPVLDRFHQYVYKRQSIVMQEAQQFANPKMQEGLVRLDGVTTQGGIREEQFASWVESLSSQRGVSEDQKISIRDLLVYHYQKLSQFHEDRKVINNTIKMYYQAKQTQEYIDIGEHRNVPIIIALANQIELLKQSIQMETELFSNTLDAISDILTPYQEAEVMVKHYEFYKDKLSSYQLLNNIWKSINLNTNTN